VIADSIRKLALVCFGLYFFLMAVPREFVVGLYTAKFQASVPVFIIFSLAIPLMALSLDYVPRAFADNRFLIRLYAWRLVTTAVLLVLLTPTLGLEGAATALVVGLALSAAYSAHRVSRLTGVSLTRLLPWRTLGRISAAGAIAALTAQLVRLEPALPPLVVMAAAAAVFAPVYALLVWTFDLLSEEERRLIGRYARRIRCVGQATPAHGSSSS
jgi:O-antigen/teichoic acid export membrane protein